MRVAILNITGGGISGGHKKYLQNMLPLLGASPEIEAILCASPARMAAKEWLPRLTNVYYCDCEPFIPFRHIPDSKLAASLDAFQPDVLFIPIERWIDYKNLPVVTMLQNMAPLAGIKTGAGIKEYLVAMARRYETKIALTRANKVITPTECVKDFLACNVGVPREKINSIHYGPTPPETSAKSPVTFPFRGRQFIFTAGSIEAYRGLEDIILALPLVKKSFPEIKLVVAGGGRPQTLGYFENLKKLASRLKVSDDIAWLGSINGAELSWCYANCSAFALTSRIESFCFVALEAMSHGCSIVSTDSPCLPEVLGSTALYYKAGDELGLSSALSSLLSQSAADRIARRGKTLERAASFSWERAAVSTIATLKAATKAGLPLAHNVLKI